MSRRTPKGLDALQKGVGGFSGILHISELFQLECKEVLLPADGRPQEAVLLLRITKHTMKNLLPLDKVVLQEKLAIQALIPLCME